MYNGILIGKEIVVLSALDKSLVKKTGLVVDETKKMLVLKGPKERFTQIPKVGMRLSLMGAVDTIIEGKDLAGTPDERIRG